MSKHHTKKDADNSSVSQENEENDIMDVIEAAKFMRKTVTTLQRAAAKREIPAAKVMGSWIFSRKKLTEFLENEMDKNLKDKEEGKD